MFLLRCLAASFLLSNQSCDHNRWFYYDVCTLKYWLIMTPGIVIMLKVCVPNNIVWMLSHFIFIPMLALSIRASQYIWAPLMKRLCRLSKNLSRYFTSEFHQLVWSQNGNFLLRPFLYLHQRVIAFQNISNIDLLHVNYKIYLTCSHNSGPHLLSVSFSQQPQAWM